MNENTSTDEVAKLKPNGETDEDVKLKLDGETNEDLLQAFNFFFIKIERAILGFEDMRLLIHNLGKSCHTRMSRNILVFLQPICSNSYQCCILLQKSPQSDYLFFISLLQGYLIVIKVNRVRKSR